MKSRMMVALFAAAFVAACSKETPAPADPAPAPAPVAADPAPVQPVAPELTPEQVVAQQVAARYPQVQVVAVDALPAGQTTIYQLTLSDQIAYTNQAVDFLMVGGELITGSGDQAVNVTRERALAAGSQLYASLPTQNAITYTYGAGQREIVVFSDPDCPFCQQLEVMFEQNKDNLNATIKVLPYPMPSHPQADTRARHILCTADPAASWRSWMLAAAQAADAAAVQAAWDGFAQANPSTAGCPAAASVDRIVAFGRELGINQTPTVFFSNGMPWYGMLTRTELEQAWGYVQANPGQPAPTAIPGQPAPAAAPAPAN